jgi:hypothetical protein
MFSTTHFAVYEHRNGSHCGYVESTTDVEPYHGRTTVGYTGHPSLKKALADLKAWKATPCDGTCRQYLIRKGTPVSMIDY